MPRVSSCRFRIFPSCWKVTQTIRERKTKTRSWAAPAPEEIAQFLHDIHLIPRGQLNAIGLAAKRPIATNSTPEGRRQNRRVDIVLVDRLSG